MRGFFELRYYTNTVGVVDWIFGPLIRRCGKPLCTW